MLSIIRMVINYNHIAAELLAVHYHYIIIHYIFKALLLHNCWIIIIFIIRLSLSLSMSLSLYSH